MKVGGNMNLVFKEFEGHPVSYLDNISKVKLKGKLF